MRVEHSAASDRVTQARERYVARGVATPQRTTTYTVAAIGAGGQRDEERVTVKVH